MGTVVLCFDGSRRSGHTNVASVYRDLARQNGSTKSFYNRSSFWWLLPGHDFRTHVQSGYEMLVKSFEPGDRVFLFGSGRGAFVVHSLARVLSSCGLIKEPDPTRIEEAYYLYRRGQTAAAVDFKQRFSRECIPHFIGMLDALAPAVASEDVLTDHSPPAAIPFAYHGVALDERWRRLFLWDETRKPRSQVLEQVWFPGTHRDVDGTSSSRALSDCALKWLLQRAAQRGLPLGADWEGEVHPGPADSPAGSSRPAFLTSFLHVFLGSRVRWPSEGALVHESVVERSQGDVGYRPTNLPVRYVVVPWKAERALDELRQETEVEGLREAVKSNPSDARLWQKLADSLQALNRHDEYLEALDRAKQLRQDAAFDANVGREIRVTSLEVGDLDFFGSFQWTVSPRINVLLGKNGYGKSHLLALMVAILQNSKPLAGEFISDRSRRDARIELEVSKDGETSPIRFTKLGFGGNGIGKVPLLAISELRFVDKSRREFEKENVGDPVDLKVNGAYHFLHHQPLGPIIHNFLYRLCLTYGERKTLDLPIVSLYHDVIRRLTSAEFRLEKIERIGNSSAFRMEVLTEGNTVSVPLQQASQGTLSIVALVSLIFDFLRAVFPGVPEDTVAAQPAIVFIDELDAHLHPSWQRKILGVLRNAFPAVQFFVAAHSPLVVAGCREGEVAVLRRLSQGDGFRLEQPDRHFVGATTTELYNLLFEIEEKDETYLQYAAMYPFRAQIQAEVKALEARKELAPEDRREFAELVVRRRTLAHKRVLGSSLLGKTELQPKEAVNLREILSEVGLDPSTGSVTTAAVTEAFSLSPTESARLAELEGRQRLPAADEKRLGQLSEDLYYLGEFERLERELAARRERESSDRLDLQERIVQSVSETPNDDRGTP